jgi:guanine nucleotide-binding protein G(i) subunit alpha
MLCFTKVDLLKEAMARVPLCDVFPDYAGGADVDAACDYVRHRFLSLMEVDSWRRVVARYISTMNTHQTSCMSGSQ